MQLHHRETRPSCIFAPIVEQAEAEDPERAVLEQDQDRLMRQALDTLPSAQRELLRLTYEQGYSVQAIATLLNCSPRTVHYQKKLACRRLAISLSLPSDPSAPPALPGSDKADQASSYLPA